MANITKMCRTLYYPCAIILISVFTSIAKGARVPRQDNNKLCILPEFPKNGRWDIYNTNTSKLPGQTVSSETIITVSCNEQYTLDGSSLTACIGGKWLSEIGECMELCPPLKNTSFIQVSCAKNGRTSNCAEPANGTLATFSCPYFYENSDLIRNPVRLCLNGKWNQESPTCSPVCGQKAIPVNALILEGKNISKSEYPWQVAIYKVYNSKKTLICSGSLLNQRVILTAAHCVTDLNGNISSKDSFTVAVGKYYRKFEDPRDNAQFSSLKSIFVPRQYKGEIQNFFGDIAILVTENTFELGPQVQPVCVDWSGKRESQFLKRHAPGYVTGWGFTEENQSPSEQLKDLEVPYIEENECLRSIPSDYEQFLTSDKICSGFRAPGKKVCIGDNGGGFVFKNYNDGRYYIAGVVSLASEIGCNSQVTLYTRVSEYMKKFILEKVHL